MKTRIRIIRPGQADVHQDHELSREPGYEALKELITPFLGGAWMERVAVLADFDQAGAPPKPTDMFVDEDGHSKGLPRNEVATAIYRRHWLNQHPGTDPETLPHIVGVAVLFDRRVWF
jgi:hypothetical protein